MFFLGRYSQYTDLHKHIFECAGNISWLQELNPKKKKSKRRRGLKRKSTSSPKKPYTPAAIVDSGSKPVTNGKKTDVSDE